MTWDRRDQPGRLLQLLHMAFTRQVLVNVKLLDSSAVRTLSGRAMTSQPGV